MEIKKILVPTDFSEQADSALAAAVAIAKKEGAEITLLHVIDVPEAEYAQGSSNIDIFGGAGGEEETGVVPQMVQIMKYVREKMQGYKDQYADVNITEKVVFDRVHRHIYKFIEQNQTDLVVMGSVGSSGLDEIVVGSNTQRVVRHAQAPVFVVKGNVETLNIKNIVLASDFGDDATKGVELLKKFQSIFGATLHLVSVITPNSFEPTPTTKMRMENFAKKHGLSNYTVNSFNFYTEEEGIMSFASDVKADLVGLGTHGRTGFSRFLMGSIAENVMNHSAVSVLTFKLK
jgi:nucleotide-binding universal stress UspA family protein